MTSKFVHDKAEAYFIDELEEYLHACEDEGMTWDEAIAEAMFEYDEFWRACLEQELENEDFTAR